jgi:7-cyano-7-deazaguanine synthase
MSGFESGLLSGAEAIPEGHYEDATMKRTVVPFRNAIMMSLAVGLAESRELSKVMLASHAGDHAVYPDCRVEFNNAFAEAARLGTHAGIEVVMPYSDITKRDIAMKGYGLGVVWPATWSCYKGADVDADILNNSNGVGAWSAKLKDVTDRPTHCGRCSTCVERIWALKGLDDDTIYDDPDFARELLIEKGEW